MPITHKIDTHTHGGERCDKRSQYRTDEQHEWTATHDQTPAEDLQGVICQLNPETATTEIIRIAFARIQGIGPSDERLVETSREDFARENAGARAKRWYCPHDDPPPLSIPDERPLDRDTGTTVARDDVRASIEHSLGDRERGCETLRGVIACSGPVGPGYRCADCLQQGLCEETILDALLDARDTVDTHEMGPTLVVEGGEH